jgi:CheY-like chemotaxis protein
MERTIRCLLVDDDIDDREIFLMIAATVGDHIRCETAGNGVEALELLQNETGEKPQYIFLDVNMPKMNGLECLEKIRRIESLKDCRVFMYSTTAEGSVVEKSKSLDAGFIVKPVDPNKLKETLTAIIGP